MRDTDGNNISNLKKVISGTQHVDHSPSPDSRRERPQQNKFRNDYDSENDDQYDSRNNRKPVNKYAQEQSYTPSPHKKGGIGSFTGRNSHLADHEIEAKKR